MAAASSRSAAAGSAASSTRTPATSARSGPRRTVTTRRRRNWWCRASRSPGVTPPGRRSRVAAAERSSYEAAGSRSSAPRSSPTTATDPPRPPRPGRARPVAVPRRTGVHRPQHLYARGLQQRIGAEQHRRLVVDLQQRLHAQPRDRSRRQPGRPGHARRRFRRRGVHGRQLLPRADRRDDDDPQPRARGRRRRLLRQQRPHGRPGDPLLEAAQEPQRRVRDRPRHLLPRSEADRRQVGDQVTVHLFAGLRVRDFHAARPWYEQLLGEPSFFPHDTEAVWMLADERSVYIVEHPEGGHSVVTIMLDDLDAQVEAIAARGLEPAERETYANGVRKVTYRDGDGNEVAFGAVPPRATPS